MILGVPGIAGSMRSSVRRFKSGEKPVGNKLLQSLLDRPPSGGLFLSGISSKSTLRAGVRARRVRKLPAPQPDHSASGVAEKLLVFKRAGWFAGEEGEMKAPGPPGALVIGVWTSCPGGYFLCFVGSIST